MFMVAQIGNTNPATFLDTFMLSSGHSRVTGSEAASVKQGTEAFKQLVIFKCNSKIHLLALQ